MLQRFLELLTLLLALVPLGGIFNYWLQKHPGSGILECLISGYFVYTTLCSFLAFFIPLDQWAFYALLPISTSLLILRPKSRQTFKRSETVPLLVVLAFSAVISSFQVQLPDEASYYLQSIYALQQDGWVKGIANLEPRFALGSSFHVLGATTILTGDTPLKLNALIWALAAYAGIDRLRKQQNTQAAYWLFLALGGLPVYFLLIPSQSPDLLGLLLMAALIEKLLIERKSSAFYPSLFLGTGILLKPNIAFSLAIVYLIWLFLARENWKSHLRYSPLWLIPLLIFIARNILQSGYPLFPLSLFPLSLPWTVPMDALSFALTALKAGHISFIGELAPASGQDWLRVVFFQLGIKSFLLWISTAGILGLLIYASIKKEKALIILSLSAVLSIPLWLSLNTLPNFRLGMHLFLPVISFLIIRIPWVQSIFQHQKAVKIAVEASLIIMGIAMFALPSIDLSSLVANQDYNKFQPLQADNLLSPKPPVYPSTYCGTTDFPCVTFDLYPKHITSFQKSAGYYYLKKEIP